MRRVHSIHVSSTLREVGCPHWGLQTLVLDTIVPFQAEKLVSWYYPSLSSVDIQNTSSYEISRTTDGESSKLDFVGPFIPVVSQTFFF